MTAYEKAQKRVNDVLIKARDEYSKLNDDIKEFEIKQANAVAEMEKASDACDLKAYNKAKHEKEDAEAALTMYNNKRDRLEAAPLLEEGEYKTLTADIINEVESYFEEFQEDLFSESVKLEAMRDEAAAKINDANKLLKTLQYDVNRGTDLVYNTGMKNPNKSSIMEISDRRLWDMVHWAGRIVGSNLYQELKKERGKEAAANE